MAKAVPTTTFRRASMPSNEAMAAFVELDDAPPGDAVRESVVVPLHAHEPAESRDESKALEIERDGAASTKKLAAAARAPRERTTRWRRKTLRRADGRELRKQTFYLDAELSHRLMVRCAEREYELSEAIEEAVNLWLTRKG